ncbi:MAG: protein kinase/lanthionine synthetase C family protein [Desulfobacterales bacterium]|nr:protein kinase/lanthionine synthetase C family protein [Desulfobacterales bacterium]
MNTPNRHIISYTSILEQYGSNILLHDPWATVNQSNRIQGWKLHLSSIQVEAIRLLESVIPSLIKNDVCFKVAINDTVLAMLNEGELGSTQVGKFITIYPTSDQHAKSLATELIQLTHGFNGPRIVTDSHLDNVVYTRYGGFNPVIYRDRLGQISLCIYDVNGELQSDSYNVPFVCPDHISYPFTDSIFHSDSYATDEKPDVLTSVDTKKKLFGPGYFVFEVVRQHPKGSIFKGIDLRSQNTVSIVIIKQGRRFCLSDEYGRDMLSRLHHQETAHNALREITCIPKAGSYFEVSGDGYLPIQYIEGKTIEDVVYDKLQEGSWDSLGDIDKLYMIELLIKLARAIESIHQAGYVHCDIAASNVWIGSDDNVYLIDLELSHKVGNTSPPYSLGTPGFMSPNREARNTPSFGDDIYSFGCVMILVFAGIDPRRILFAGEIKRFAQIQYLTKLPVFVVQNILECLSTDESSNFTTIEKICFILESYKSSLQSGTIRDPQGLYTSTHSVDHEKTFHTDNSILAETVDFNKTIEKAQLGLLKDVAIDQKSGLWLSVPTKTSHSNYNASRGAYEVYRSINRGVAGGVYILSRLARFGFATKEACKRTQLSVKWLLRNEDSSDSGLPGLHFGEAGVAVSLAEGISSGYIESTKAIRKVLTEKLRSYPDWPDITHGAAGQGIAALYCGDLLKDSAYHELSKKYVSYLLETQADDGSWKMPQGVDGISGETLTGFAHGVSGIVYFLIEYDRRFKDKDVKKSWQYGVDWLISKAKTTKNIMEWSYSDKTAESWKWWCHGSPGIALTFLRLYEYTRNEYYAEIVNKALSVHPWNIRYPNLSQCHGLSGLGEIYFEAWCVLKDRDWYNKAKEIANTICYLGKETDSGKLTWLVEDPHIPTVDFMVGSGGILHFLLRMSQSDERISYPLLIDPKN